ncbi:MAG: hypothetical protein WAN59_11395 [Candidatus Baltobacteraceae bacterium]
MIAIARWLAARFLTTARTSTEELPSTARLHVPRSVVTTLREITRPTPRCVEPLALLRARYASEGSRNVVVGVGTIPFPETAYVPGPAGANFDTDWLVGIANREIGANVGLLLVHSHGGRGTPGFSSVDRRTNAHVMAPLAIGINTAPYGAMVLSGDGANAVVTLDGILTPAEVIPVMDRLAGSEARG